MRININNAPRRYSVIYADPPWAYKQQGGAKGRGTAKAHYDTMQTAEICALPVKEIATEDALLFMWATFPNIKDALEVMEAWGFGYKTAAFVWVKTNAKSGSLFWGMGSYTRANAEVCLLGIRKKTKAGKCVKAHNIHQIIQAPYTRHSEKPPETRERIKALTGSEGGYLELFARQAAPGWDCWGNEAPGEEVLRQCDIVLETERDASQNAPSKNFSG